MAVPCQPASRASTALPTVPVPCTESDCEPILDLLRHLTSLCCVRGPQGQLLPAGQQVFEGDSVLVETYHVQPGDGGAPLVTYRIYIDLAPGHELQMVGPFEDMMGHAGAVVVHPDGLIESATDPRSDGAAIAF